jgi:hypothetical protein
MMLCGRGAAAPLVALCAAFAVTSCSSIGPPAVARDRVDYADSVAESWKEQTLLNIVRLRYADAPVFLDVSSVVTSYALQNQVTASGILAIDSATSLVNLGANTTYLDRPTISYTPLTGDRFTKSLLRPIPPVAVFSLIQAGFAADFVLWVTVRAINGVYNRSSGARGRPADPDFFPLLAALRRIQQSGILGTRLEKRAGEETALVFFPSRPAPEQERDIRFVADTLKLKPEKGEVQLVFGATQRSPNELAVLSRSMLEILIELSAGVDVPETDLAEGRTIGGIPAGAQTMAARAIVPIHSGSTRPDNAFVAARYRGKWFWVDDRDFEGKRAFTFLMMFFSLAETGVSPQAPVLTLPAN